MKHEIVRPHVEFVNMHFVSETYHENHSQLVHKHSDVLELLYIMQGNGQYIVNGRTYVVRQGSLIICNANVMHGETPYWKHSLQSYCCVLRGLNLPSLPPNTLSSCSSNPVYFFSEDRTAFEHTLLALYEISTRSAGSHEVCNLLVNALLNMVYAKIHKRQLPDELIHKNNEEFIQNITQFLEEHYAEPLSLEELGKTFHISPSHLSHIFKTEIGLPPMKYLLYLKIGEAQNLLMNTAQPISVISDQLSFHDISHFSRMFKKYIGVTPTEYRQNFRSSDSSD